jgi:hypothetical protein
MEPEGSLPCLLVPATCPYPKPDQLCPSLPIHFLQIHLNIILPSKTKTKHFTGLQVRREQDQKVKSSFIQYQTYKSINTDLPSLRPSPKILGIYHFLCQALGREFI